MSDPIINAFVTLILTVGILGLILFFVKKYGNKMTGGKMGSNIKVQGKLSLSPKTHLYIVEVEGKRILIGTNDNSISRLSELDLIDQNSNPDIKDIPSLDSQENLSFKDFIKSTINKNN